MGGAGGGYFRTGSPENVRDALRREEESTEDKIFETQVAEDIAGLLVEYNDRDVNAIKLALERLRKALEKEIEDGSISPVFGGSVRKHTYVDGVSDIDALFVLKGDELTGLDPEQALDFFDGEVKAVFPRANIERDKMSITIEDEGMVLQILPAVRREGNLCIPSNSGKEWSKINPENFLRKLTEVNDNLGGKVVPAIKIFKGMNDGFPEDQKLSGYHIESLAIEAFKDYTGPLNTKAMVEHFIGSSATRVLSPIKDKTGQSVHVDEYAGPKGSICRKLMAQNLDRIWRKAKNANASRSREKWMELLNQEGR
jgi:hypothetical protein